MLIQNNISTSSPMYSLGVLPDEIVGLTAWYDASQENYNDGDNVNIWNDLSGNNYNLEQTTASKQPIFKTNIKNDLPVVRADGVDDFMDSPAIGLTQPTTYFLVAQLSVNSGQQILISGAQDERQQLWNGIDNWKYFAGLLVEITHNSTNKFCVFSTLFKGSNSYAYINGEDMPKIEFTSNAGLNNNNIVRINADDTPSAYSGADYAELIIYDRELTSNERNQIISYLADKWGVIL